VSAVVADSGERIPASLRAVVELNKTGILALFQIMYIIHFAVDVLYMHLIFHHFFVIFEG
jgi:hypothetical protein